MSATVDEQDWRDKFFNFSISRRRRIGRDTMVVLVAVKRDREDLCGWVCRTKIAKQVGRIRRERMACSVASGLQRMKRDTEENVEEESECK
ncbi:hypothetical protein TSUD_362590 [Trifolium subterraneum]|uniref:Uncharacterized protein n=1 Tax=Trifolium subterraneum TaxID=3900 RepID=A0A2Z6NYM4_TRISU|nr:hypothetical protein TSUD_362590 [Trifolium subterraneum]